MCAIKVWCGWWQDKDDDDADELVDDDVCDVDDDKLVDDGDYDDDDEIVRPLARS